mmetsp:Transcript_55244/g.131704  ORF Transcript_55244/g.131704 Transcript_55244/m.131704 type:complete len:91 (-) Transcript_55244:521-793(-)
MEVHEATDEQRHCRHEDDERQHDEGPAAPHNREEKKTTKHGDDEGNNYEWPCSVQILKPSLSECAGVENFRINAVSSELHGPGTIPGAKL